MEIQSTGVGGARKRVVDRWGVNSVTVWRAGGRKYLISALFFQPFSLDPVSGVPKAHSIIWRQSMSPYSPYTYTWAILLTSTRGLCFQGAV